MVPVIVGSGLAGLSLALALAPRPVLVVTTQGPGQTTSSVLAQGGLAAALGTDDSPAQHANDTLRAGAGLCDPEAVARFTRLGPRVVQTLESWGARFDRDSYGQHVLSLEGAHSVRRVAHVRGDSTGAALTEALVHRAAATPSVRFLTGARAVAIRTEGEHVTGLDVLHEGRRQRLGTDTVILATGGAGALWESTTNPAGSWGAGLALAAGVGAVLRNLEFMQFHPTALAVPRRAERPLISEALRGEGAFLVNNLGEAFMADVPGRDLAPRDVVASAIHRQIHSGRRVALDARGLTDFAQRFPTVARLCAEEGLDPARDLLPVEPTAHYHMGGIEVDGAGRTSVPGLWACGEVACTGLHGANRLASNSLLEAVAMGLLAADALSESGNAPSAPWPVEDSATEAPAPESTVPDDPTSLPDPAPLQAIMTRHVGLVRSESGLREAIRLLQPLAIQDPRAQVGLLIATAALARRESRGAHIREDAPV